MGCAAAAQKLKPMAMVEVCRGINGSSHEFLPTSANHMRQNVSGGRWRMPYYLRKHWAFAVCSSRQHAFKNRRVNLIHDTTVSLRKQWHSLAVSSSLLTHPQVVYPSSNNRCISGNIDAIVGYYHRLTQPPARTWKTVVIRNVVVQRKKY